MQRDRATFYYQSDEITVDLELRADLFLDPAVLFVSRVYTARVIMRDIVFRGRRICK